MDLMSLSATLRTGTGKGVARKLRKGGLAPAVCYGLKKEPAHVNVEPNALMKVFKGPLGRNAVFHLVVGEEAAPRQVIVKDLQIHPVRRTIQHVDFLEVADDTKLTLKVPVRLAGRSPGEKLGGQRRQVLKELPIVCTPHCIPAEIAVDMAPLNIGDTLYVEDIKFPEGVESGFRGRVPVVTLRGGRAEDEAGEGAAAAPAK